MLKRLNPNKLHIEFRTGVTMTEPITGRRYTLTHSDATADLFLTIGKKYAYDKFTAMRDEVLAHWQPWNGYLFLYVYVLVDNQPDSSRSAERYAIFRRELPLALEAIRYGDGVFFAAHPGLDNVPIWVYFDSKKPEYNRFECWGTLYDYK